MAVDIRNPKTLPKELRVFYSWQSDLPKKVNQSLIKKSLLAAIARINQEMPDEADCPLVFDSGVDGRSGSPDIANVIFEKIENSHIIVADVSVVARTGDNAAVSNPNVMTELGYGAGKLGWSRVICLCNEAFGKIEELAFDLRSRRMSPYTCADDSGAKLAARGLDELLYIALRAAIEEMDHGPPEKTPKLAAVKRERDLALLKDLLTTIDRHSFDVFGEKANASIFWYDILFYWEGFRAVVTSMHFRFYDKRLQTLAQTLFESWDSCLDAGGPIFKPGRDPSQLFLKEFEYFGEKEHELLEDFGGYAAKTVQDARKLYDYVHEAYPELDLDEMDRLTAVYNKPYLNPDTPKKPRKKKDTKK